MSDPVRFSWSSPSAHETSILVHGGAGDVAPDRRASHEEGCRSAASAGHAVLARGGSALDAVQAAVEWMEDDPRYNAGTGGSLDEDGELRLDACIMEGELLRTGAVAALPAFRHPVAVARAVLVDGRHVLYAHDGAARFARASGFELHPGMVTEAALKKLAEVRAGGTANWAGGTVGAVARDVQGHVAAATSTGGMVGKRHGRVGDSPIPGAGNYADDRAGAASGTGEGEGYLRTTLCARACFYLEEGLSAQDAAGRAMRYLMDRTHMRGGLILVAKDGRLGFARTTETMSWAAAWNGAERPSSGCG